MCSRVSVVVLDNGGRENATVWGDILTLVAHQRGVAGTVIDGACRDTHLARELGYPVFSRSYSMRTGKDRVQVEAVNAIVNIGDARVAPGDLLRGDADGVVVLPREHEDAILAAAEEIDAIEQQIRAAVTRGRRSPKRDGSSAITGCRPASHSAHVPIGVDDAPCSGCRRLIAADRSRGTSLSPQRMTTASSWRLMTMGSGSCRSIHT